MKKTFKNRLKYPPGPSSTDKGLPVLRTGSPTVTPDVSSYTCFGSSLALTLKK